MSDTKSGRVAATTYHSSFPISPGRLPRLRVRGKVPAVFTKGSSDSKKNGEWQDEPWETESDDRKLYIPFVPGVNYYYVGTPENHEGPVSRLLGALPRNQSEKNGKPVQESMERLPYTAGRLFSGLKPGQVVNHPGVYKHIETWCREA